MYRGCKKKPLWGTRVGIYPGQYFDQETGLHYNYHRYYDPKTGRYVTADPSHLPQARGGMIPYVLPFLLPFPQELNLYSYVLNNPANWTDPWGLTQRDIDIAISIVSQTQADLKLPKNVVPSLKSEKYAGEYRYLGDKLLLNEKYLQELSDKQAEDLLDTIMHEILHANDPVWKQIQDSFRPHPDIENEAARRAKEILQRYLKERKANPCE